MLKSKRMRRSGHVARMRDYKRLKDSAKWKDCIMKISCECGDWDNMGQDMDVW
jgi:hypothetical protein